MDKCRGCGAELEDPPANEKRVTNINCLGHFFLFFRRKCPNCKCWVGDRLYEPPPIQRIVV
jgi:hypothetical protein